MPSLCHKFCLHEEFLLLYTIKKNSWATPKQFTNNEPKLNWAKISGTSPSWPLTNRKAVSSLIVYFCVTKTLTTDLNVHI